MVPTSWTDQVFVTFRTKLQTNHQPKAGIVEENIDLFGSRERWT
jgi:hypothetical protein